MRAITKTIAVAGFAAIALTACGSGGGTKTAAGAQRATLAADNTSPTIKVSGHGKVEGTPDTATVTLGVETHAPTASDALRKNNDEAAKLIATLKGRGVAAKDIQTSDLSVRPDYGKDNHITGYAVSNTVTVRMHDIKNAGSMIDAAAEGAGNDIRVQGVMFSIDNTSDLVAKARANAVNEAASEAQQLATAANVKLGAIQTIVDANIDQPTPLYASAGVTASLPAGDSVPIEVGSQRLTVDVNVVYNIAG